MSRVTRRLATMRGLPTVEDRAWMDHAACSADPERWFSDNITEIASAQAICDTVCPVATYCASYSERHPGTYGVWAGRDRGVRRRREGFKDAP